MAGKIKYREGTVFAVPLSGADFLAGLVCRMNGRGSVFGHFFLPRFTSLQDMVPAALASGGRPILSGMFGELGITKGHWPLVGELSDFARADWPLPEFVRYVEGNPYVTRYSDDLTALSDRMMSQENVGEDMCEDGLMGYVFVEHRLEKLLRKP